MTRATAPEAIPYLLLGETRRRSLQERLGILVDRWYRTWAPETAAEPHAELSNDVTPTIRGETWTFVASQAQQPVVQATVPVDSLRMLGGGPGVGSLTNTVDAWHGGLVAVLTERVVAALCTDILHSAFPAAACTVHRLGRTANMMVTRPGSGAQTLVVSIATDRPRPALELLLTSSVVDALLAGRPVAPRGEPMMGRRKASHEQCVAISAVLGSATVSWRDLQALCVDDVIVLDQNLATPCTLQIGGTTPIADAQLGRIDDMLAAQVTRIRPPQ